MKKFFAIVLVTILTVNGFAQGKTAYISTDEVFANIPQVKAADSLIRRENDRLSNLYNDRQDELNVLYKAFVDDSAKMTTEVKEMNRKKLQEKVTAFQASKQDLQNELEGFKEKMYAPIKEKILVAIRDLTKAKGYTTCLYREGAVFFPPNDDITKAVIKKMVGK
jgi:outer membrane protein